MMPFCDSELSLSRRKERLRGYCRVKTKETQNSNAERSPGGLETKSADAEVIVETF